MTAAFDPLGIELISVMAMPPVEFVALAAELGVRRIGLAATPITANPHGFPGWNLATDATLRRKTRAALADHGVTVVLGEGFLMMPEIEIADAAPALDAMAELSVPRVNSIVMEADRSRAFDQFNRFAEMAAERAMDATIEFLPLAWPATLAEAVAFVKDSGAPNGQVLVDAMHLFRSGGTAEDLAAVDPALIGHIQLCDVPMPARNPDYGDEARHERLAPGDGDLPLAEFIAAAPRGLTIGLEVPMLAKAQAGIGARERLAPAIAAAMELLAGVRV
jgi:sugar phosphate isomerase/epimerase